MYCIYSNQYWISVFCTHFGEYGDSHFKIKFQLRIVKYLYQTTYYENSNLQNNNCYEDDSLEKITIFFYLR